MRHAKLSSCYGAVAQVMVKDSSVFIIFAALLGAGEMISVMTTSLVDMGVALLMIPFAYLSDRFGLKRQSVTASLVTLGAMTLAAAAPWFGGAAGAVLVLSLSIFSVAISAHLAAWFPLLDGVVPPAERSVFFGHMRFLWQLVSAVFVFLSGWFVGRYATIGRLQIIILIGALGALGRAWHVSRITELPAPEMLNIRATLADILRNRPLVGFSVYLFFLYATAGAAVPVVFVFCRNHLAMPDNMVVLLSAVSMAGLIVGYLFGGIFIKRYGAKPVFLAAHMFFGILNFMLLAAHKGSAGTFAFVSAIVFVYGFLFACASVGVSSELPALASPRNKAVSIAFGFSLYSAGIGFSRGATSLVLGSGMLAPAWTAMGVGFTHYHSLFLAFGCGVISVSVLLVLIPALVGPARAT